jgi:septum formation protein
MKIVLATTSSHRIEIMELTGIAFEAKASDVEEKYEGRPDDPEELVRQLSKLKAEAVAKDCLDSFVIGFDSVAFFGSTVLEKPKTYEEAFDRLKRISGRYHDHYTGITLINTVTNQVFQRVVKSKIYLREISDEEIKRYLDADPGYKTHAYGYEAIGQLSATFIKKVDGDFYSFARGMPIATVVEMIEEAQK